jgi:uncharacterized membrane protein
MTKNGSNHTLKKNFITGLVILLPFVLTVWIVMFLLNLLTNPFIGFVKEVFHTTGNTALLFSRILIILGLIVFIILVGILGRFLILKSIFKYGDSLLHKIPLINKVYKSAQDVVQTLFEDKKTSFSQVVLVPFPHSSAHCIGLVTNADVGEENLNISVFVPGTPNPTMGFMLLFKKEQLVFLDMKPEEALKFIISCGVIVPPFQLMEIP